MLDFFLMLHMKLFFAERIHPQSNNFADVTGVENKVTDDSKLNYSPRNKDFEVFFFMSDMLLTLLVLFSVHSFFFTEYLVIEE